MVDASISDWHDAFSAMHVEVWSTEHRTQDWTIASFRGSVLLGAAKAGALDCARVSRWLLVAVGGYRWKTCRGHCWQMGGWCGRLGLGELPIGWFFSFSFCLGFAFGLASYELLEDIVFLALVTVDLEKAMRMDICSVLI